MAQQLRGIGEHLRECRLRRRMSQLDLAVEADISTRHLSFVETGRAQPSRDMQRAAPYPAPQGLAPRTRNLAE